MRRLQRKLLVGSGLCLTLIVGLGAASPAAAVNAPGGASEAKGERPWQAVDALLGNEALPSQPGPEAAQAGERAAGLSLAAFPTSLAHREAYLELGRARPLLDSDLPQALTHLGQARAKAPKGLLPFISYYEAQAHSLGGDYKKALALYQTIYKEEVWAGPWQDKILAELFACLFYLGEYQDFARLFREHERAIMGSPGLEKVLFFAAQVFEKQKNYDAMFTVLEQAALLYPVTPHARYAFSKLSDYACEDPTLAPRPAAGRYYFSTRLLRAIARNAAMDQGIREFVMAMSYSKVRLNRYGEAQHLDDYARVKFLFDTRLYEEAYELAKGLYHDQRAEAPTSKQRQDLLVLLGRLGNRLNKHQDASLFYAQALSETKAPREVLQLNEYLADSLSYGGFGGSAADLYASLAQKSQKPLLRWHHFWTSYISGGATTALALLQQKGKQSYVPARDGAYPLSPRYWQARLLEQQKRSNEASALYQQVLAEGGDNIYSQLVASRFPDLPGLRAANTPAQWATSRVWWPSTAKATAPDSSPRAWAESLLALKTEGRLGEDLELAVGLACAGISDFSKMLVNALPLASVRGEALDELIGLAEHAQAYYLMHEGARRLITSQSKGASGWWALAKHQQEALPLWQSYYPLAYAEHLKPVSTSLQIDPFLVLSVVRAESNYRENALSYVGARGLMQIMPYTAMQIASRLGHESFRLSALWQPKVNLTYGSWYLKKLLTYYSGHPALAVAAYNAGPFAVNSWLDRCQNCRVDEFIETISFHETRRYVKEVLRHYTRYHRLYGNQADFGSLVPSDLPASRPLYADLF